MILMRTSLERLKTKKRAGHLPVKLTCFHSRTWVAELLFRPLVKESNAPDMDRQCDQVLECVMSDAHLVPKVISGKRCNDPVLDQGVVHDLSVRALQERLAELERSEQEQSAETAQEFEFRARLEKQPEAQEALESELLAKMETLKSVHTSWMLDQDEIVQKRDELHRMPGVRHADWRDRPRQCRVELTGISISSKVCT